MLKNVPDSTQLEKYLQEEKTNLVVEEPKLDLSIDTDSTVEIKEVSFISSWE